MRRLISFVFFSTVTFFMVSCGTVPKEEDLQQLKRAHLLELLPGNTLAYTANYGRWVNYHKDGETGVGKAFGNRLEEKANHKYTVNQNGEVCYTFMGEPDWAKPEHKYCSLIFTGQSGIYYSRITENTWNRKNIGQLRKVEIIEGDRYKLAKN